MLLQCEAAGYLSAGGVYEPTRMSISDFLTSARSSGFKYSEGIAVSFGVKSFRSFSGEVPVSIVSNPAEWQLFDMAKEVSFAGDLALIEIQALTEVAYSRLGLHSESIEKACFEAGKSLLLISCFEKYLSTTAFGIFHYLESGMDTTPLIRRGYNRGRLQYVHL